MLKKILCILSLLILLPVHAGELEEASRTNAKIFLYLYTPDCTYCTKFQPIYSKLVPKYSKNCKFLKIDANTEYGTILMRRLNAFYVPYVVLIDNKKQTLQRVTPNCLLNNACMKDAVNKFID